MADDLLPELGDLLFSVLIGYAGALEFLYVVRHLYHWSCGHMATTQNDAESLKRLQERMRCQLAEAEAKELQTGTQVMKDGVLYKDGFRVDAEKLENDRLSAEQNTPEAREKRKREIEAELKRQREIEEQTHKQLAEAEAQLERQRKQAAEEEEEARKLLEAERARELEQKRQEQEREAEEEARKLLERERLREEEERRREAEEEARMKREAEEEVRRAAAAEAERKHAEEEERKRAEKEAELLKATEVSAAKEAEEQTRKLLETERQHELEQHKQEENEEAANNERKLLEAERLREAEQLILEQEDIQDSDEPESLLDELEDEQKRVFSNEIRASHKQTEPGETETLDSIMQLLDAESDRQLRERDFEEAATHERVERQRLIEENARKFLEADQEMEELLESVQKQRRLSATESAPQSPLLEEPCVRKTMSPLSDNSESTGERLTQTVKTQFGQTSNEPYSLTTKPLLFKSISDDTPSFEPQSSLSAQHSDEYGADADGELHSTIDVQITQLERQAPDGGEDNDTSASQQYTEDYLRSLDGIKQRPLVREDGSGRRRAFKKRRSSGSSNSSYESRASREEEVKMFTSLEEEELKPTKEGDADFTPIKYASEPLLKVKMPRRRHKRSPAKDAKPSESGIRGSLEMLDEEANTNPWGEVTPEHYKDMPFWKREKSMSIDEEAIELESPATEKEEGRDVNARNEPKALAFEEASHTQNEEAISVLQRQQTKEEQETADQQPASDEAARNDIQTNLHTASQSPIDRKSASPRLRRSPRIDEMDQYEELWNKTNETISPQVPTTPTTPTTPSITVNHAPDTAPWRDQYGLLMEGLSDFYDFTASMNPSRSRSTSRQPSPANSQPSTPAPKNVEFLPPQDSNANTIDIYDDTESVMEAELTKENVVNFIESLQNDCTRLSQTIGQQLQVVADSPNVNTEGAEDSSRREMNLLVQTLRVERQSRSRSRSPLPTGAQLERSVEVRRKKLIEQNDKLFETLNLQAASAVKTNQQSIESSTGDISARDQMRLLVEEQRNRPRSRSHSPLPTADNLERSLETRRSRRIKHNDEVIEKLGLDVNVSRTPSPAVENPTSPTEVQIEKAADNTTSPMEEDSKESMSRLVESLRVDRTHSHSRSRSRSPLPTPENLRTGLEQRRKKKIQQNDALFQQLHMDVSTLADDASTSSGVRSFTAPIISIECFDEDPGKEKSDIRNAENEYSLDNMTSLVESLRLQRSRSKSPMRRLERERTPEPSNIRVGLMGTDQLSDCEDEHDRRSRTPSRSISPKRVSMHAQQSNEESSFQVLLNLEASQNRTLFKSSEEMESLLAEKQRQVDAEALRKLNNASEEIELRTVTPISPAGNANENKLDSLPLDEHMRQLRCSPTTPDYDRTISQEWGDVQRIKDEMLTSGFKRSTYVGESLDLGSEFAPLREQTARFRRSRSPSPSLVATETQAEKSERREVQDKILAELISESELVTDAKRLGAKPKELRSASRDYQETQYDELRRMNAEFQRSRSQSRSPLGEVEAKEVAKIEEEATKRELQDTLSSLAKPSLNFEEFSRYLNAGFLDNERRASDSALIQKPEVIIQLQELEEDFEVEPENYHHFRRFSLNQEQSIEEYPNDDYVFVSQIEVQTPSGTRTWIREDYYSEDFEQLSLLTEERAASVALTVDALKAAAGEQRHVGGEEEETDGSEDERQTVVEVEDEIDEDICDFNERGPADESHHEQSECEEAEREMDHYADREANDWQHVENIDELLGDENLFVAEEGAVGGDAVGENVFDYDSDSAAIDEIYDEAIKNRKQSGILRDYDSILKEMQNNYLNNAGATDGSEGDMSAASDGERKKSTKGKREGEAALKLIKNERREHELRYLGDASECERQSTRLRTRYGYMPQLHGSGVEDLDMEVDLSYKPKREYNWRKNFKIDDEDEVNANKADENIVETEANAVGSNYLDLRKFSLGGESITLFSQGSEGVCYVADENQLAADTIPEEKECIDGVAEPLGLGSGAAMEQEEPATTAVDKPKKKKSKKKLRKDSRNNSTEYYAKDEDDSESQLSSRRNSSVQMEANSPKRPKSRSRRNSRNSLTNDESLSLFSPRSSVVVESALDDLTQDCAGAFNKKKLKKRKKTKDGFSAAATADIKEELASELNERAPYFDLSVNVPTASAAVTPGTASINPLATLSPQNSICTPASSIGSETPDIKELISAPSSTEGSPLQQGNESTAIEARISTAADALISSPTEATSSAAVTVATRTSITPTTTTRTTVDTFDILKDANFYPLF
ncbi:PREDICTED: trichohyalin-like [Rhagoletis zephyria]|uniref:trichohyalin-like n=1 Tax=Rhagoletis zephyria TaxID=28612 RepID=UPI0008114C47|nr:PREDICTED: trichohyalin-like [Rhagoletis zephyria]